MTDTQEKVKIVFTPSGKRGSFEIGTKVLDAARQLGVDIDSVCGGRAICGRCQINVLVGDFAKHNIHSDFTSITNKELNHKIDIIFLDPPYNYSVNKNMFDPIIKKIKNSTVIIFERKSSSNSLNLNFMRIFDERVVGKTKFIFLKKFN